MHTDHAATKRIAFVVLTRAGLNLALRLLAVSSKQIEKDIRVSWPPAPFTEELYKQKPKVSIDFALGADTAGEWPKYDERDDAESRRGRFTVPIADLSASVFTNSPAASGTDVHIYASPRAWKALDAIADQAEAYLTHRSITRFETVAPLLSQIWTTYDQIVLFLALGAVVRLIAPLLRHKHEDPGIVAIDDAGRFAISVVSGHIGDANGLATRCAALLGAIPVVTTASDVHNTLAADVLAHTQGWQVEDPSAMTAVSAAIVNGEAVAVLQDCGELDWWGNERPWPGNLIHVTSHQEVSATHFAALLVIADRLIEGLPRDVPTLVYRPPTLVLGIGCRRGVSFSTLDTFVKETLAEQRVALQSIALLATADIKADEAALQLLAQRYGWSFETHAVTALKTMTEVPNPSERVQRLVGTPSVCEAAALLSSNGGELIVPKQKGEGMTIAVARLAPTIYLEQAGGR